MGTRRSIGGDLEGCDSAIVWLELVIVKWLDGLGEEDGLLSLESRSRRPSKWCRECIKPVWVLLVRVTVGKLRVFYLQIVGELTLRNFVFGWLYKLLVT